MQSKSGRHWPPSSVLILVLILHRFLSLSLSLSLWKKNRHECLYSSLYMFLQILSIHCTKTCSPIKCVSIFYSESARWASLWKVKAWNICKEKHALRLLRKRETCAWFTKERGLEKRICSWEWWAVKWELRNVLQLLSVNPYVVYMKLI